MESEVTEWLASLADEGVHLAEPFSRQVSGKLRELRLGRRQVRITYCIATGRRIVLLTVLPKIRPRERREVQRAEDAMRRCIGQRPYR